jgi:hypothetical protein
LLLEIGHCHARSGDFGPNAPAVLEVYLAGACQAEASRGTIEQAQSQSLFELGDPLTDRRLWDAEADARLREASRVSNLGHKDHIVHIVHAALPINDFGDASHRPAFPKAMAGSTFALNGRWFSFNFKDWGETPFDGEGREVILYCTVKYLA